MEPINFIFGGSLPSDYGTQLLEFDKNRTGKQSLQYGCTFKDSERVSKIIPGDMVTVETSRNEYSACSLVVCAGPWARKVLAPVGLTLPLKALRISVYYWKQTANQHTVEAGFPTFRIFTGDFLSNPDTHAYGLPICEYPDLVKVALHTGTPVDPDFRDAEKENPEVLEDLTSFIKDYMPFLKATPSLVDQCIYTLTPDEDFILDRHPRYPNIIIGAGFSGHGFKLAPVVGRILAELATNQRLTYDIRPFRLTRF